MERYRWARRGGVGRVGQAVSDRPRNWRDHWLLNWRLRSHFCIRLMPGLWIPAIYNNRRKRYFAVVLPFFGITFDYL